MNSLGINKSKKETKVVVAMSGGVDSSVVAALMKEEGYDVKGITLKLYDDTKQSKEGRQCCAGQDIIDAKRVSEKININHEILLNAAEVVEVHCAMCHAKYPSWERMSRPPKGLILANKDDIILNIDSLYQQVVLSNAMPPGNITWMEYTERKLLNYYIKRF